jgi:DNA invertase Pin-like site-specific DNA recombinase
MEINMEIKKAAVYARVSTNQQDTENQLIELRRYCEARGWQAVEFIDNGFSGALGEDKRPALKALMDAARKRQVDTVIVWDFSRFARSMRHLVEALDLFRAWGVSFISLREGIDTSTANGRLVFGIFASLAEFERELIRERVNLGLKRARAQGKQLGRPKAAIDPATAHRMRHEGRSLREIASALSVSKSTIAALLSEKPLPIRALGPVEAAV